MEVNMKKLIVILSVLFFASFAHAWKVSWDASAGADGYYLYYKDLTAQDFIELDVGNVTERSLDDIGLIEGTRYEFYVQAYVGSPRSLSGESDHIRWTYPSAVIIIETMEAPKAVYIMP
jgi:hypothetical protein